MARLKAASRILSPRFLGSSAHCVTSTPVRRISSLTLSEEPSVCLSTVHRGTAFEHRAMAILRYLSMSLLRVGGRNDGGIDLQGWWWLPDSLSVSTDRGDEADLTVDGSGVYRRRVRVLAQCKAERKKLGPNYVREMEGVLHRHLHVPDTDDVAAKAVPTVALLVSESEFTKATVLCALSSPLPFFLLHLPRVSSLASPDTDSNPQNTIASAIWNPALGGQRGVLGGTIDLRWELSQNSLNHTRPSLWWHGRRLESWVPDSER